MGRLFGTDGVRGAANEELTPELAFRLGRAIGQLLYREAKQRSSDGKLSGSHGSQAGRRRSSRGSSSPKVVIGKDTRISSDMLEAALWAGLNSAGVDVLRAGVIPTPGVSFLVKKYAADGGAMISASHNPYDDNGIKFFWNDGKKLPDEMEMKIEALVLSLEDEGGRVTGKEIGKVAFEVKDAVNSYGAFLQGCFPDLSLEGMHLVLDCANGATYRVAPRVLKALGARVTLLHARPNGVNINDHAGSTHPDALKREVVRQEADMGLAFDGDGDRVIGVDGHGNLVNGDRMLVALALNLKRKGKLRKNLVVATVMSNWGLEKALESDGIQVIRCKVGDRYVLEEMERCGASLGGEQSGHLILTEWASGGDGILTALAVLECMKEEKKSLGELAAMMKEFPQLLVNVRTERKDLLEDDLEFSRQIKEIEEQMKGRGRLVVRPSGTEPLVRVMAEGLDRKELEDFVGKVVTLIEERLR